MAHKQKTTVYVLRRTDKKDPKDTTLIFGAPGGCNEGYPNNVTFVTSDRRVADKYEDEMTRLWGDTDTYMVESREVRV